MLRPPREEAGEGESLERKSRADERRERGVRPRQRRHRDPLHDGTPREIGTGVGDAGQSRIADANDVFARLQRLDEERPFFRLVVLVITRHPPMNVVVREQRARMPCVLCRDEICRAQRLHRTVRHIAEVADGRRAKVERSRFCHIDPSILYSLLCVIADAPPLVKRKLRLPAVVMRLPAPCKRQIKGSFQRERTSAKGVPNLFTSA